MYREAGISLEMADHENVIAVVTWGNRPEDLDRLIKGAESIARAEAGKRQPLLRRNFQFSDLPEMAIPPREAYFRPKRKVAWRNAAGETAGESAAPYPPGIPLGLPRRSAGTGRVGRTGAVQKGGNFPAWARFAAA